jgi:hypothetical protein
MTFFGEKKRRARLFIVTAAGTKRRDVDAAENPSAAVVDCDDFWS